MKLFRVLCVAMFVLLFGYAGTVDAATMFPLPSSGEKTVGAIFSLKVYVESTSQAINAAGATLSFPTDMLEVVSVSREDSIISLWMQEPTFSNTYGTVRFEGIVFDPGFTGSRGQVLTIHFRTKRIGTASVTLDSATVLANDGMATEILTGTGKASYTIVAGSAVPVEVAKPIVVEDTASKKGTLAAPTVVSDTHPNQETWYSNSSPHFTWENSAGVTAVRTLIDDDPSSVPTVVYDPSIQEKQVQNLEDGTWYFHVQSKDENGWGGVAHYRVNIDTEKPRDLTITEFEKTDATVPTAQFTLDAKDDVSGIDHYEIEVGSEVFTWTPEKEDFVTPILQPGEYMFSVKAFDRAGNITGGWVKFVIEGIMTPEVESMPTTVTAGESFEIRGKTSNLAKMVYVYVTDRFGEIQEFPTSDISEDGSFFVVVQGVLSPGDYAVTLTTEDERGAKSNESAKLPLTVLVPGLFGLTAMNVLYIIVALVFTVVLLFVLLILRHRKIEQLIERLGKQVGEVDTGMVRAATLLKSDIEKQVASIKSDRPSKKLTKTERELVETMQQDMTDLELYLKKQIAEVEGLLTDENEHKG